MLGTSLRKIPPLSKGEATTERTLPSLKKRGWGRFSFAHKKAPMRGL